MPQAIAEKRFKPRTLQKLAELISGLSDDAPVARNRAEVRDLFRNARLTEPRLYGRRGSNELKESLQDDLSGRTYSEIASLMRSLCLFEIFEEEWEKPKLSRRETIEQLNKILRPEGLFVSDDNGNSVTITTPKVFLIHGRDEDCLTQVESYIKEIGLTPVILKKTPAPPGTFLLEHLLNQAGSIDFAIALLTPDDVGALKSEQQELQGRARQNVILELGLFIGYLGTNRVAVVCKTPIELPSDIQGIIYSALSDDAWKHSLRTAFLDADLLAD